VSVRGAGEGLEVGRPTTLVPADRLQAVLQAPDYDDWDVTPDGQRFLVKQPDAPDERPRIHLLLDWTSVGAR
jgi:hypothetical protein